MPDAPPACRPGVAWRHPEETTVTGKVVFLFPGQGAQKVGMGKELHDAFREAREVFEEASDTLGVDMKQLCFEGPEEALQRTVNTQPAVLIHSVACLRLLRQTGIEAQAAAGHSLGEYTAHVAAGSIEFVDALRIVRRRGELMYEAGLRWPGAMAAVLGLPPERLSDLLEQAGEQGIIQAANLNSPRQVVVSGESAPVELAIDLAPGLGARRAIRLPVSGAFHSPLMESAAEGLREVLATTAISDAAFPVIANATAGPVREADSIRRSLEEQLLARVRWEESMRWLVAEEFEAGIELGPGTVLRSLAREIDRSLPVHSVSKPADLDAVATAWEAARS